MTGAPYCTCTLNQPIYENDMPKGVFGMANSNGTIIVDKNLNPKEKEQTISHEMVHVDQIKRGDLDYDKANVYWKGKTYSRSKMNEGDNDLPWEKEAYKKEK